MFWTVWASPLQYASSRDPAANGVYTSCKHYSYECVTPSARRISFTRLYPFPPCEEQCVDNLRAPFHSPRSGGAGYERKVSFYHRRASGCAAAGDGGGSNHDLRASHPRSRRADTERDGLSRGLE